MSEQMPEQAGLEPAAAAANPQPGENSTEPEAASHVDESLKSYSIAPDHEAPKADAPKPDTPKEDVIKSEVSKSEVSKSEVSKSEVSKGEVARIESSKFEVSRFDADKDREPEPAKMIVMPPADRSRSRQDFRARAQAQEERKAAQRRPSAMAVIVLAGLVGAISGALATGGVMQFATSPAAKVADASASEASSPAAKVADNSALEASIARIDADIAALKASLDRTAKAEVGQLNKTSERLDKLEKAQAEPMAKLAKLSESVDKLRASQQTAAREATGSTPSTTPTQTAAAASSKPEVARLPTVEGWRLRDVGNGSALIEGRSGLYEVFAGAPVPGLGRIDAIRRQDGRWVVVTSKGLIVAH